MKLLPGPGVLQPDATALAPDFTLHVRQLG